MKPDYKNWVPKPMVVWLWTGAAVALVLFVLFGATELLWNGTPRIVCAAVFGLGTLALLFFAVWMTVLYRTFDYGGKRRLTKRIIDGTAAYVSLPDGGFGLDVGCGSGALTIACAKRNPRAVMVGCDIWCGSGALTIACAKRNPRAVMVGCDIWSGAYKAVFTKELCEKNAKAEDAANTRFEEGNALKLPYPDETFDAVTSNYVYHNITGADKQKLLSETLRVLKKGGRFAIHDLMSPARYGDMDAFVKKLRDSGYEDVRLIPTTDGTFMGKTEAAWLGLGGSTLLVGKK